MVWDICLRRNLTDSEPDEYFHLLKLLSSLHIRPEDEESLEWWHDPSGSVSVKSSYVCNTQCTLDPVVAHRFGRLKLVLELFVSSVDNGSQENPHPG